MSLSDSDRNRVSAVVKHYTEMHRTAKRTPGYENIKAVAIQIFDSQEDFNLCRPEDKGRDFLDYNEFAAEVMKGLLENQVPARPVTMRYARFAKWLGGRRISQDSRADYASYVLTDPGKTSGADR
jgi:hypothetical protein